MKTSNNKTTITIFQVTSEFVWEMNVFEDVKKKRCKDYIKKIKWDQYIYIDYDVITLS